MDIRRLVKLNESYVASGSVTNLLANPGGESAVGSTWVGSFTTAPTTALNITTADRRPNTSGSNSLMMDWTTLDNLETVGVTSNQVAVSSSARVWGYGWVKRSLPNTSQAATLKIEWFTSGMASLGSNILETRSTSGVAATDWQELKGSATAPATAAFAKLTISAVGLTSGTNPVTFYADDLALVQDINYGGPWISGTVALPNKMSYSTDVLLDLEVDQKYMATRDSFSIKSAPRKTVLANNNLRYGGSVAVSETHDNASAEWTLIVKGSTADAAAAAIENLLAELEPLIRRGVYLEWRPDGVTNSIFYEVRGPATWQVNYQRIKFITTNTVEITVQIPLSPLGRGITEAQEFNTTITTPAVFQLPEPVKGAAPAQTDILFQLTDTTSNPVFALLAWWNRLPTVPNNVNNVFGLIQAETTATGMSPTTWTSTGHAEASGGNYLAATAAPNGTATAKYNVSTAGIKTDYVDVEIWARVALAGSTLSSTKMTVSFSSGRGSAIYTREWGIAGRPLIGSNNANPFKLTRLGTVSLPVKGVGPDWVMQVAAAWGTPSGTPAIGLDWIMLVPVDQRAVSPSGEPFDVAYPKFLEPGSTGSPLTKRISTDLSGSVAIGNGTLAGTPGLGGSLLELPPGDVDMAVILSAGPADDNASSTPANKQQDVSLQGLITPRYFAAATL